MGHSASFTRPPGKMNNVLPTSSIPRCNAPALLENDTRLLRPSVGSTSRLSSLPAPSVHGGICADILGNHLAGLAHPYDAGIQGHEINNKLSGHAISPSYSFGTGLHASHRDARRAVACVFCHSVPLHTAAGSTGNINVISLTARSPCHSISPIKVRITSSSCRNAPAVHIFLTRAMPVHKRTVGAVWASSTSVKVALK